MSDPHVRELGFVEDIDERLIRIGVDYDTVTVAGYRLSSVQAEDFAALFVAACWQAARCGIEQELAT